MSKIAASLAMAALQVVESALRNEAPINPAGLGAVNAGLSGLVTSGLEPTPQQADAVNAAIDNLLVFGEEKAEAEVEHFEAQPVVEDAPPPPA